MKNTQFKKKKIFYTLSLCLLVVILSAAAVSVFAEDTASSGWTFTEDTVTNPVYVKEYFTELPRAYEAVVNFPAENYSGTSPIISNKPNNDTRNCFGFEITKEGKPKIFYYETSYVTNTLTKTKTDVVFNYSVIGQGDVRLTVVNEIVDSTSVYKLYVNGVILNDATVTNTVVHDFDAEYSQSTARELSIGGDGADRFKGTLYSLAVYNNALTEAEAANTAKANMEEGSTKLMAYYDSAMSGNSDGFIKDQTGKGHDASEAFFERKNALNDYAYSFAFVGDTQFLVYKDITGKTTKYASPIYDWIVQNKDEKKIEYVLGMGDVTDKNEHAEWEYAVDLHNKLGDADIPYAVIPGNHDGGNRFNAYFGDVASFTDNIDGKKADSDFQNYYMNFEVGQHKYMIVALQYGAPDEVLTWANGVVEANPDRRVIVITHNLFDYEGKLNEAGQREQSTTSNTNLNNGIDMWDEFIKRHKNIIIAAAGHVDPEHIKHSTYEGVNQNTVHTFLIDPQGLDNATRHETGMVAMFYFSEDGSDVQVEYISTYKTLESQKADSSADDILFHERNQFSFTTTAVPSYDTAYGNIPEGKDNNIVLFKKDSSSETGYTCVNGYSTFGAAATVAGLTGTADTTDYVILFRADYPHSSAVSISNYTNNVTIDLGGYTVTLNTGGCGFLHLGAVTHADAKNPKTITIKNGYFECTASGSGSTSTSVIVLKNSSSSNHYVNCENINIKSTSPAYPAVSTAGASTSSNTVNAVFTDCVFDFTSAPTNCFMFASGAGTNLGKLNATIRGGKILAGSNSSIVAINSASSGKGLAFYGGYASSNSNDKLYIEKNAKGEYLKLVLNSSALAPAQTNVYTTTDGVECVFVEASDDGTNTTYTLYPKVMLGYKIKTSVTLYSNFVYNIYVPATNAVSAVYIDGEVVVLDESMITMIEEANYYRIQVSLPASKSLNDITVAVSLASGETTVNAKWTSNVVNYAKTVMDGDSSEIEKTLIRDMLSYAASAHTYFKTTEAVADKLSEITSILGENYDANNKVTVTEDAAKQPADNTYFTSVAIYLGEVPSFRFYLASGYEAIDFAFTVGGRDVETISIDTNGDGTADCIEIVMYAYMMLDDISYTVVSKDTETTVTEYYNLYAYYKYVSSLSGDAADVNLVSIVERLMKYSASADAYRESVVNSTSES